MTPDDLAQVMEATWPPARMWQQGPFILRDGAGGGKRVAAASCDGDWTDADIDAAERAMADPLILIRAGDEALDAALQARDWRLVDPVVAYAAPVEQLRTELAPLAAFAHWPPLQIACSIWEDGGIGPARVAVMDRVTGAKCTILARSADRPAGAAFVACIGQDAMLHALEVRPHQRRRGVGGILLHAAANWASLQGAVRLSLVVTAQNTAARALYARLGMQVVGHYHYRMK
jgi:GNAT superfamily N-acetyltransferase